MLGFQRGCEPAPPPSYQSSRERKWLAVGHVGLSVCIEMDHTHAHNQPLSLPLRLHSPTLPGRCLPHISTTSVRSAWQRARFPHRPKLAGVLSTKHMPLGWTSLLIFRMYWDAQRMKWLICSAFVHESIQSASLQPCWWLKKASILPALFQDCYTLGNGSPAFRYSLFLELANLPVCIFSLFSSDWWGGAFARSAGWTWCLAVCKHPQCFTHEYGSHGPGCCTSVGC